ITLHLFVLQHTAPSDIYTLSLHDALPIYLHVTRNTEFVRNVTVSTLQRARRLKLEKRSVSSLHNPSENQEHSLQCVHSILGELRSEEHTSELQSRENLVCRLLLEKKKKRC